MSIDQLSPPGTELVEVRNPATGELVGSVAVQSAEAVAAVVDELRTHQSSWEELGPDARAGWLRKLRNWLLDNESRLIDILVAETGKPRVEARFEVMVTCDAINYYADRARKFLAEKKFRPHGPLTTTKKLSRVYRPYPVVGVITPWNFPLLIPGVDAVAALLAGAAVVVKSSEVTPLSARELARGWERIGAPPVFACVTGLGATGAAVVDSVDMVQFTGSTRTGRAIAARAGERLIPCGVELGGKDPAIVLADADLSRAANGIAWGALFNSGQACISVERVYVEAPAYDRFVALLTERVRSIRQGVDNGSYSTDVGSFGHRAAGRDREEPRPGCRRPRGHDRDRRKDDRQRRVLRAHNSSRRRSFDGLYARRDLRPDDSGDEGRRRSRGDPAGKRLPVRAVGNGVDQRHRSRT